MTYRKFSIVLVILLFVRTLSVLADNNFPEGEMEWSYSILPEAENKIDLEKSSVYMDYEKQEIVLSKAAETLPNIIDVAEDGYDYAIATKNGVKRFLFNGSEMIEVEASMVPIENPLGVAMVPGGPDIIVSYAGDEGTNIERYSFGSKGMEKVPSCELIGVEFGFSIDTIRDVCGLLVLDENAQIYGYDGDQRIVGPYMTASGLNNPLAVASANEYNIAVLEPEGVRWFMFDGSQMMHIPALSITETFSNPRSVSIRGNEIAVLDEYDVFFYEFDSAMDAMEKHTYFTSTTFTEPCGMVLKPDAKEIVIVDSPEEEGLPFAVRYFTFDGSQYVEVELLGAEVYDVMVEGNYARQCELVSKTVFPGKDQDMFRIRAYTDIPENTSIEWHILADEQWHPSWRVVHKDNEIKVEKWLPEIVGSGFNYADGDWHYYGGLEHSYPIFDFFEIDIEYELDPESGAIGYKEPYLMQRLLVDLWSYLPEGNSFKWKAVLRTEDPWVTPRIYQPNIDDIAIKWDTAKRQIVSPDIEDEDDGYHEDPDRFAPQPGWVYTTTPLFKWNFGNVDFEQTAFHFIMTAKKNGGWEIVLDTLDETGKIMTRENKYRVPTSYDTTQPGPMWNADTYEFAVFVRTWDNKGIPTDFSEIKKFKVLAFERPRIAELATLPENYKELYNGILPKMNDSETHYMVKRGMMFDELPRVHAGSQITILLDSVGPIMEPVKEMPYFYIDKGNNKIELTLGDCERVSLAGATNNRWILNFWTEAPILEVPVGTIIKADFIGEGTEGGTTVFYVPPYAEGIAVTEGTVYETWDVVLQGSNR